VGNGWSDWPPRQELTGDGQGDFHLGPAFLLVSGCIRMQQSYGPFQGDKHLLEFVISAIFLIERDQGGRGPTILLGSFEFSFTIRDQTNKRMNSFVIIYLQCRLCLFASCFVVGQSWPVLGPSPVPVIHLAHSQHNGR